ncbi:hypothetical protein C453_00615 [Haloferax elongans ATCC BAA-1513]|uniref:Uncharacterized protein n=1 Tax=Haloferax elongans ATCC BAA-1513 TaxID=1230453 RepID=M0I0L5_HALEO|nr:hypothetical protein [Haloferax elongans]ELZ89533.1 hypothetical protein C453_00615 [Haloferax elongans ATCC BAA-1513]
MNVKIIDKDNRGIGVSVTDNNGVEHTVAVGFDGDIQGHSQDGYGDQPENRTPDENEHVSQARRRARYHVYQETEFTPFPPEENLPGIKKVKQAIEDLSVEEFESYFSDAYDQVLSNHPSVTPPVPHPESVPQNGYLLYLIDVYLNDNDEIEAVSDIHLQYLDDNGDKTQDWNDDPFPDRQPDARLQLFGKYVPSMEVFQEFVVYHLRCQLRDVYIGAGLEPPEEYRVLGRGNDELTGRYHNEEITVYEDYHLEEADIPGYELEFDYGFGELGKQSVINAKRKGISGGNPDDADSRLANPSQDGKEGLLETISSVLRGSDTDQTET